MPGTGAGKANEATCAGRGQGGAQVSRSRSTARACASPVGVAPLSAASLRQRVPILGREGGRRGGRPPAPARGHVTPAEEIGGAAARGCRLVQRTVLAAGPPPPPRLSPGNLDDAFRLALPSAASPPPRRLEEQEKTQPGRRR
ncbi:uncharacterized protein LOC124901350 [Homo sapiens]|uniref:uncharacterized protein LOC124901350 n=1 Tax=Homo sapiens TaxID=9606 RepID=UPI0007DC5D4E|nr:uncharacterized protein LOC124901350 [Homo sapiens]